LRAPALRQPGPVEAGLGHAVSALVATIVSMRTGIAELEAAMSVEFIEDSSILAALHPVGLKGPAWVRAIPGFDRQSPGILVPGGSWRIFKRSPSLGWLDARRHLGLGLDHRVPAHPRRLRHRALIAHQLRRRPRHHPALPPVQMGKQTAEESREPFDADLHIFILYRAIYSAVDP
jgi:hypothetical protein